MARRNRATDVDDLRFVISMPGEPPAELDIEDADREKVKREEARGDRTRDALLKAWKIYLNLKKHREADARTKQTAVGRAIPSEVPPARARTGELPTGAGAGHSRHSERTGD